MTYKITNATGSVTYSKKDYTDITDIIDAVKWGVQFPTGAIIMRSDGARFGMDGRMIV